MTSMKTLMNDVHWDRWESRPLFTQMRCTAFQFRSWVPPPKREIVSRVKKKGVVLKRAMTAKRERWQ